MSGISPVARCTETLRPKLRLRALRNHRQLPGIAVDAFRFAVGNNKRVAEEYSEHAVGGDGIRLNHEHHAGLEHLFVLLGLYVIREGVWLGTHEIDAMNMNRPRLDAALAVKLSRLDKFIQVMPRARDGDHLLETG